MMKKLLGIVGVLLIICTIVLAVLYILRVKEIQLGYCIISMLACFLTFGVRRLIK